MANKYDADFSKPPETSPKWTNGDSLGIKIETMFLRFIQRFIHWGYEFFSELAVDIFDASMKILRPGLARVSDPVINNLLAQKDLPDWYRTALTNALNEKGESSFLIKLAVFYSGIAQMVFGGIAPIRRLAEYNADKDARSYLPSPQELATLHRLGLVSDEKYNENMAKLGVAEPLIPVYTEYVRNLPSVGELFAGFWRGIYSESEFNATLKRMNYNDKDVALYKELTNNLPNLQDLIRMLVRDAFNDSASNKYGYDEDYPAAINEFFAKQGYNPDWAKRYWRAHWNLPSPQQVYEMLHRGFIDQDTMVELLRIADYPKFWRDKLVNISFNPITRVDLRRLYQSGIIPEDRLIKGYQDIGYNPEDAKLLAEFAKKGNAEKEKDLSRADILGLYEDNIIDVGQAKEALIKLGYDQQETDYLIEQSDFNIARAQRADHIQYTKERYTAKLINKTGVTTDLTAAGLSQIQIDRYLLAWDRANETLITLPSKADITKWYITDAITEQDFRARMKELHYRDTDIDIYVTAINKDKQAATSTGA